MRRILTILAALVFFGTIGSVLWMMEPSAQPKPAETRAASNFTDFSKWAVVLVSGDYRAHSGAPSKVFDNGRRDLAAAFAKLGFTKANTAEFSVDYDPGTQHTTIDDIGTAMRSVADKAKGGCLLYFTSHGTPEGMVVGEQILSPVLMNEMVAGSCGTRPAVIVMSACYSGQFVPVLANDNRVVMSASRADRTSFGCGETDQYTYFDDCFLRALPMAGDFPGLGELVQQCVAFREEQMKAKPPSEPQLSVGPNVIYTLRWRDAPPPGSPGGPPQQ